MIRINASALRSISTEPNRSPFEMKRVFQPERLPLAGDWVPKAAFGRCTQGSIATGQRSAARFFVVRSLLYETSERGALAVLRRTQPHDSARPIWSTRRFRRKSGETVGRIIDRMKRLLEEHDPLVVIDIAAKTIHTRLRPSAFAIVVDLLLADGKIDARERKCLQRLAVNLRIPARLATDVIKVMLVKNHL